MFNVMVKHHHDGKTRHIFLKTILVAKFGKDQQLRKDDNEIIVPDSQKNNSDDDLNDCFEDENGSDNEGIDDSKNDNNNNKLSGEITVEAWHDVLYYTLYACRTVSRRFTRFATDGKLRFTLDKFKREYLMKKEETRQRIFGNSNIYSISEQKKIMKDIYDSGSWFWCTSHRGSLLLNKLMDIPMAKKIIEHCATICM